MRSAMKRAGGDPQKINPLVPVDLVIDHSVQVDDFGSKLALLNNTKKEFERNLERYEFLKWGQKAFHNFEVVPPSQRIVHQVNLEYLAKVVQVRGITQLLRAHGVVEKFVEFYGDGLASMSVADRATIANMAPEYGATMGFFPVDEQTLAYLRLTGREENHIDLVERYCKEQSLWRRSTSAPSLSEVLEP